MGCSALNIKLDSTTDYLSQEILPDEVALHLLSFFNCKELANVALVNRRFYQLSNDSSLWRPIIAKIPYLMTNRTPEKIQAGPRRTYIEHTAIEQNRRLGIYGLTYLSCLKPDGEACEVECVAFWGDKKIISGSNDGKVCIWDIETLTCTRTLEGHTGMVNSVTTLGGKVVSGANDGTIRIWGDVEVTVLSVQNKPQIEFKCLAIFEEFIVSGSDDGIVRIWNPTTAKEENILEGHTEDVLCLAILDQRIVSGSCDQTVRLWHPKTEQVVVFEGHTDSISCLSILGGNIVSGSYDGTIRVWDTEIQKEKKKYGDELNQILSLTTLGDHITFGLWDRQVYILDPNKLSVKKLDKAGDIDLMSNDLASLGSRVICAEWSRIAIYDFLNVGRK